MLGQRGSLKSLAVITYPKNSIWFHKIVSGRHYGDKYKGKFYNYWRSILYKTNPNSYCDLNLHTGLVILNSLKPFKIMPIHKYTK